MTQKNLLRIAIASSAVVMLGVVTALAILFMPTKSTWADDYRQYANDLASDDPVRLELEPMLADGQLSIWEISRVLCGEAYGCQLNNFADVLLSPEAADMFAQSVLIGLKRGAIVRERKKPNASSQRRLA